MDLHTVVALILSGAIGISLGLLDLLNVVGGTGAWISGGHPDEVGSVALSSKN